MEAFLHATGSVTILAFLTAMGCVRARTKWLKQESKQFISNSLMNIAIPVTIIYSIVANLSRRDLPGYEKVMLVPLAVTLLLFFAACLLVKVMYLPREQKGVFWQCAASAIRF